MKPKLIAAGALFGLAAYFWSSRHDDTGGESGGAVSEAVEYIGDLVETAGAEIMPYQLAISRPRNAGYVEKISQVEAANGIPAGLMLRLAWQECRFRADIIDGRTVSSAGAAGMWQLMPIHWKTVDPLNWSAAADYAGGELRRLYRVFGTWQLALAAYNWGEGNLKKYGIARAPLETRNYYAQILGDIGVAIA